MSDTLFRVGLAGLSEAAAVDLLPALRGACIQRHARLVAVSGADRERTRALLGDPAVEVHTSAQALVAAAGLDGLVVADTTDQPERVALDAVSHGIHVLTGAAALASSPEGIQQVSRAARPEDLRFHVEHVSRRLVAGRDAFLTGLGLGRVTGIRATWHGPDAAIGAPGLIGLTTPVATVLPATRLDLRAANRIGDGVRARWEAPDGTPVEIEVDPGATLAGDGEAHLVLYTSERARLDLPLALPERMPALDRRLLRGVLWHPTHGALPTTPPPSVRGCLQESVEVWLRACRAHGSPPPSLARAELAAMLAADLAHVLGGDR